MRSKQISKVLVHQTGPQRFAVVSINGETIRDGFRSRAGAFMWAGKNGLHKGAVRRAREVAELPVDLAGEQLLRPKLIAALEGISYGQALQGVKTGRYGPPIRVNERDFSVRRRHYEESARQRELAIK